jgi:hypothetical protein
MIRFGMVGVNEIQSSALIQVLEICLNDWGEKCINSGFRHLGNEVTAVSSSVETLCSSSFSVCKALLSVTFDLGYRILFIESSEFRSGQL